MTDSMKPMNDDELSTLLERACCAVLHGPDSITLPSAKIALLAREVLDHRRIPITSAIRARTTDGWRVHTLEDYGKTIAILVRDGAATPSVIGRGADFDDALQCANQKVALLHKVRS